MCYSRTPGTGGLVTLHTTGKFTGDSGGRADEGGELAVASHLRLFAQLTSLLPPIPLLYPSPSYLSPILSMSSYSLPFLPSLCHFPSSLFPADTAKRHLWLRLPVGTLTFLLNTFMLPPTAQPAVLSWMLH